MTLGHPAGPPARLRGPGWGGRRNPAAPTLIDPHLPTGTGGQYWEGPSSICHWGLTLTSHRLFFAPDLGACCCGLARRDDISRSSLSSLQHSCICMPSGAGSLHAGGCLAPRAFPAGSSQQEYLGHSGRPSTPLPHNPAGRPWHRQAVALLQELQTPPLTVLSARSQGARGGR